jgi:hypothetical protein
MNLPRLAIAAALVIAAILSASSKPAVPTPAPNAGDLVLVGKFVGPTAAQDAATTAAMFSELADELSYDADRPGGPHMTTGVAFDDLRVRAFDLRCRGQKIGDRQSKVREAIKGYLEAKVGVSGGPVSPEQRTAWIAALREIGRAAGDAAR